MAPAEETLAMIGVGIGSAVLILTATTRTAPDHRPPLFPSPSMRAPPTFGEPAAYTRRSSIRMCPMVRAGAVK